MAKRDPVKTQRNRVINQMTQQLKEMEMNIYPILQQYNLSIASFKAKIGSKHDEFMNIKQVVVHSPENFVALYFDGMIKYIQDNGRYGAYYELQQLLAQNPPLRIYAELFLRRTYLRYQDSLIRVRPVDDDSYMWIGQQNANYGIFITPRFNSRGYWENDISEIRHTKYNYWTIGHILETGLVIPNKNRQIFFHSVEEYLNFFCYTIVRNSGSNYELQIAELYREYVLNSDDPMNVPLLIPEYRYDGISRMHKYRLDFMIINPYTLQKQGFEISPWSTHGKLSGIKGLTQKQINEMAMANRQKEINKMRDFYSRFGIVIITFIDEDFTDINSAFSEIATYLTPEKMFTIQLYEARERFVNFS